MKKFRTKKQFFPIFYEDIQAVGENAARLVGLLNDRMKSSRRRNSFKDDRGYYIIFTYQQIKEVLGWGSEKISNNFDVLIDAGYVTTKSTFTANRIYLPKFDDYFETEDNSSLDNESSKIEVSTVRKPNTNQNNLNQKNKTSNTRHTEKVKKQKNHNNNFEELPLHEQIQLWKTSVTGKAKLNSYDVDRVIRYCKTPKRYNLKKCKKIIGFIYKAKRSVAKANNLSDEDPKTRFENNTNMQELGMTLERIFSKSKKAKNEFAYIFASLKNFFTEAMGLEQPEKQVTPESVNKRENYSFSRRGHRDVKIPEWMKKKYDPSKDKVDPKLKKEAEMMIAKINNMSKVRKLEN